jgi:hypothetical protein
MLGSSARLCRVESKVGKEAERALVEATQRLTPEERLHAFVRHCRLVTQLYAAGARMRADKSFQKP